MAPSRDADDATSAATSVGEVSLSEGRQGRDPPLTRLFRSCESDPQGSVHRAWAASVLCMLLFFIFAIIEANKLREDATSAVTLQVAAYYTAAVHFILMILGTFVLKRFATDFTVGCFLGVTLILSQQDLLMCAAFSKYGHGDSSANVIFANLALGLFLCLVFFTLIMGHFKDMIIIA